MEFKEKTLKKTYVYNGKILSLRKDDIALPDGKCAIREIVEHSVEVPFIVKKIIKFCL